MLPIKLKLPDGFLEEEVRCGYTVTAETKKLWAVELDLLNELDKVCKAHNIKYYANAGTLLGAVRHKGFIPWDDDIDIMMPRKDYEKLCKHYKEFSSPYFFQTEYTDPGSLRGHAQLRNSKTTGILKSELNAGFTFNQGIFIDIFPLDNLPDNKKEKRKFIKKVLRMQKLTKLFRNVPAKKGYGRNKLKIAIKKIIAPFLLITNKAFKVDHKLYKKYEKLMQKYNGIKTKEVGLMNFLYVLGRNEWNRSLFENDPIIMNFEMLKMPVPSGYDKMLTKTYGEWREYQIGSTQHGGMFVDTDNCYKKYLKKKDR